MTRTFLFIFLLISTTVIAQEIKDFQKPGLYNPIVPGYFADPTLKKIGDTYYLYATTDGNGWGAGPSQVWISKDFVNWSLKPMNWPDTHWYWAPDMTKGYDGKYYLYYSQPVEIFGASSESPVGPWSPLRPEGKSIIPNYMIPGVITLDAQTFTDDDGSIYMFWGTWGIYPEHGCAVGLLNKDMTTFSKVEKIPNTIAKDFFEAPYMFKRNGIYYMMYSSGRCEDHTYRVQYVKSTSGPFGPYEYPEHNPILVTNEDGTVHGPGHHSILQEDEDFYIVYHRHNNPNSGGGFHRQIAADKMHFDEKGDIINITPTHQGIGLLAKNTIPFVNQTLNKAVTASSEYNEDFRASFVADDNNGTLWRAADNMNPAWIQIDLGSTKQIKTILTQFEYATWYYEYLIEYSIDGKSWKTFADKRKNRVWGSPLADFGDSKMRYIRIHIFDTQIAGLPKGIWNIKAFEEKLNVDFYTSEIQTAAAKPERKGILIDISAERKIPGESINSIDNKGRLSGKFSSSSPVNIEIIQGKKGFVFSDKNHFLSDFEVPASLSGNSSFSVVMDVFNPEIDRYEPVLTWSVGRQDLGIAEFGYGTDKTRGAVTHGAWPDMPFKNVPKAGKWHKIAITFDGYMEKIWVDGRLIHEANRMLFIQKGEKFTLGSDAFKENFFEGMISSLQVYDSALERSEIFRESEKTEAPIYYFTATDLDYKKEKKWPNRGQLGGVSHSMKITDFNGKQSVTFSGQHLISDETSKHLSAGKRLTFQASPISRASSLYKINGIENDSTWYIVAVNESGEYTVNGKTQKGKIYLSDLRLDHTAVSRWMISTDDVQQIQQAWQKSTDFTFLKTARLTAAKSSTEDLLFSVSHEAAKGIQYYFSNGNESSEWLNVPYFLFEKADFTKPFTVKIKDQAGNVSQEIVYSQTIGNVLEITPDMSTKTDFLVKPETSFWTNVVTHTNPDSLLTKIVQNNQEINLSSAHSGWNGHGNKGPFLYKKLEGDFTFTVEISNITGFEQKKSSSTEAGIMVRNLESGAENHIQNTILTGWNIGNMTTHSKNGRRIQKNNGSGWNYMRYLQIQKTGDTFYLRGSNDAQKWINLPGSPITAPELVNKPLAVGLFQASNNNTEGFGSFRNIRLTVEK